MSLTVSIHDFRGVADFEARTDGILLVAGSNGAGKTSVCMAVAAAASGAILPAGLTKKTAILLVREGGKRATVTVGIDETTAAAAWPDAERAIGGRWRDASPTAAGTLDPLALKPAERAAWLSDLLHPEPTKADLLAELIAEGIAPASVDALWARIEKDGWDASWKWVLETGTKTKGHWEAATGERYGAAKAIGWRPAAWRSGISAFDLAELQRTRDFAIETQKKTRAARAESEAQARRARALAEQRQQAEAALPAAEGALAAARERARAAETPTHAAGAGGQWIMACPCCNEQIALTASGLIPAPAQSIDAATAAELAETCRIAGNAEIAAESTVKRLRAQIEAASIGGDESGVEEADPEEDARLQHAVDEATADAKMLEQVIEAEAAHKKIVMLLAAAKALAPDGLRQKALLAQLADFNLKLAQRATLANWPAPFLGDDMAITMLGRPIGLCSAGEQFRARVLFQLAAAHIESAPLVVVDGADVLDRAGRNGLFRLAREGARPAVIGMTLLRREDLPDLEKAGLGRSVWLGD